MLSSDRTQEPAAISRFIWMSLVFSAAYCNDDQPLYRTVFGAGKQYYSRNYTVHYTQ